jgi:hypothetical protein
MHEGHQRMRSLANRNCRRSFDLLLCGLSEDDAGCEGRDLEELSIHVFFLLWHLQPFV